LTPEEVLIEGCKRKERGAQKLLFEKYASKMMGICIRYMGNEHDAQDLLHDGFIKVFMKMTSFKGNSSLSTWMSRIFVNLALNKLQRGKGKWQFEEINDAHYQAEPDESFPQGIDGAVVLEELNRLPENYKLVLNMYAIDGLSHKEIAEATGLSESNSKSRLFRARVMLKENLKSRGYFE
jgi:RNA polymerase sigma-70 factor (ECF subfamily)